jgi:REase_DpnII-MboI
MITACATLRPMPNHRLSRGLCATVASAPRGSHDELDALFESAGAPLPPPNLSHARKWKEWLFRCGTDPNVDSLSVLGNVLEEFMDVRPPDYGGQVDAWENNRGRVVEALEAEGPRYYRGGRVLLNGQVPQIAQPQATDYVGLTKPTQIDEVIELLVTKLPRAMHPLTHRRKGAQSLSLSTEWDVQDLLHALLRPWVADIRPEEFTPSYAGSSTRMDFLLPKHKLVIELNFVRNKEHARKVGNELIIDIAHYEKHQGCDRLWCVVYDPDHLIVNPEGLKEDLERPRSSKEGTVQVKVLVLHA